MCVLVEEICGSDPVSCDECLTGVRCDNNEYVDTTTSTSTMGDSVATMKHGVSGCVRGYVILAHGSRSNDDTVFVGGHAVRW